MTILTPQDFQGMRLPVNLSDYNPNDLVYLIRQAEAWVNGEARYARGFEAHRVVDRIYGTGTNHLFTNFYPVLNLNAVDLVFPPNTGNNVNLPGPSTVPIDPTRIIIDHQTGELINWSPFVFQTIGYMTVFPDGVPINVDYYAGYVAVATASTVLAGTNLIPVTNNSYFYYGQVCQFYDAVNPEYITIQGTTTQGGVPIAIAQETTQFQHLVQTSFGDMPPEVRLATAYVVCDFALFEANPEDLDSLRVDKITKTYGRSMPSRAAQQGSNPDSEPIDLERPLIREARRLLSHYRTDRGIR